MAFGGPRSLDEVAPFIERMTGREPSPEAVKRSRDKYAAIGGASPLPAIAESVAAALRELLEEEGLRLPVALGMRYSEPSIADVVQELAESGVTELVALSLSPFESRITTQAYREAVEAAAGESGVTVLHAPDWSQDRGLLDAHRWALEEALSSSAAAGPEARTMVVFSAHSLPCAEVEEDDSYIRAFIRTADEVALAAGLLAGSDGGSSVMPGAYGAGGEIPWVAAYQSKGYRACEWLGPDLDDALAAARDAGIERVVVSPVGFVIDHMETLYDLDVVAARKARDFGLTFARCRMPNAGAGLVGALASAVVRALDERDRD